MKNIEKIFDENYMEYDKESKTLIIKNKEISDNEFENVEGIKKIICKNVNSIGNEAFKNCTSLKEIVFDNTLITIGKDCFDKTNITHLSFPSSLESMGRLAFLSKIESVEIDKDNYYYTSKDGVVFTKDESTIVWYPTFKKDKTYVFPETVNVVYSEAFCCNTIMETLDMRNAKRLTYLNYNNFFGFNSLKKVYFPENLRELGRTCFFNCEHLDEVSLPESLISIPSYCFMRDNKKKIILNVPEKNKKKIEMSIKWQDAMHDYNKIILREKEDFLDMAISGKITFKQANTSIKQEER